MPKRGQEQGLPTLEEVAREIFAQDSAFGATWEDLRRVDQDAYLWRAAIRRRIEHGA